MTDDINQVIARLSVKEKSILTSGLDTWHINGCDRLAIAPVKVSDGPNGARGETKNHLSITPSLCLPCGLGLGASFDENLVKLGGKILARQVKEKGASLLLAPTLNLARHLAWGRCFESFSEDPLHAGYIGSAFIEGVQSENVIATAKHYVGNESESERYTVSSEIDERTLREIYLLPFEYAVKKGLVLAVMTSYSRVNSAFVSDQPSLIQDILRDEWGFQGIVMTDWYANFTQKESFDAGLDIEMPGPPRYFGSNLVEQVENSILSKDILDRKVYNLLYVLQKVGIIDLKLCLEIIKGYENQPSESNYDDYRKQSAYYIGEPVGQEFLNGSGEKPLDRESDRLIQYELAKGAIVLLENNGLLPLDHLNPDSLAIVGPHSKHLAIMGGGSARVLPHRAYSFLELMQEALPNTEIYSPDNGPDGEDIVPDCELSRDYVQNAVSLAQKSQYVIVMLGTNDVIESEGYDKYNLSLPSGQDQLAEEVLKVNKNTIVVVNSGTPVIMPWAKGCPALIQAFFGGMEMAPALRDVLLGITEPTGRLPVSIPLDVCHTPASCDFPGSNSHICYSEKIFMGYRWYEKRKIEVLYPFGYGLSYAHFNIKDTKFTRGQSENNLFQFEVSVANTSAKPGSEVIQVYISYCSPAKFRHLPRPVKELKRFAKVYLLPGEEKSISFNLHKRDFAYYDPADQQWEQLKKLNSDLLYSHGANESFIHREQPGWYVDQGQYEIMIGRSSADITNVLKVDIDDSFGPLGKNEPLF